MKSFRVRLILQCPLENNSKVCYTVGTARNRKAGIKKMALLESGEMYLETILVLTKRMGKGAVRSIDIATQTGYSKPSVSRAVGILKDGGFIEISDGGYITLTTEGENIASTIYERHVTLTNFFVKIGVSEETAAADACKIEHCLSKETFAKLKKHIKSL